MFSVVTLVTISSFVVVSSYLLKMKQTLSNYQLLPTVSVPTLSIDWLYLLREHRVEEAILMKL